MAVKNLRYCYREIDYPKKLFLGGLWVENEDKKLIPFVMSQVYKNFNDLQKFTDANFEYVRKKIKVIDDGLLVSLNFEGLYPLKKKYWENPSVDVSAEARLRKFIDFLEHPESYKLLVTPRAHIGKRNIFSPTFPFLRNARNEDVEAFMLSSTEVVDHTAKHAAFYTPDLVVGINWKTKKLYHPKEEKNQIEKN